MSSKHVVAFLVGALLSAAVAGMLWWSSDVSPQRLRRALMEHPEFLADHPDLLEAGRAALESRLLASQGAQRAASIQNKWQSLIHVESTPTIGSADAPLVMLEFTDYTCAPCRASAPAVSAALQNNSDVRVAVLLLPTGGAMAEYAARVAVAAYRQHPELFAELHHRLLQPAGPLTQASILAAVREAGYDTEQIEQDASSLESRRYFEQVRLLAEDLRISGVPAFALNEQLVMGGVTPGQLETLIHAARAARAADRLGNAP